MNIKFTRNMLNENFRFIVVVPNNKLENVILNYDAKIGYNSGLYGWNYDVFVIDGIAFIKGYRPAKGLELPA